MYKFTCAVQGMFTVKCASHISRIVQLETDHLDDDYYGPVSNLLDLWDAVVFHYPAIKRP